MAPWLILAIGVVYLVVAADLLRTGQLGLALTFFAYSLGNVGLYWAAQ